MTEREIILTVYRIDAKLIDSTSYGDPHSRYHHGYITVHAEGDGERHSWQVTDSARYRIGDRITSIVLEDDPPPRDESEPSPPPPIDKRTKGDA